MNPGDTIRQALRERAPIIGMVHLGPLPGSPRWAGSMDEVARAALEDARILVEEGAAGVLVENFGDAPFYPSTVPAQTVAAMSVVMDRLRRELDSGGTVWGVNVLRNDALAALAVAAASGADFVRVNVLCGVTATDQGWVTGAAHEVLRQRSAWAPHVAILADVRVKHGMSISWPSLEDEAADLIERGGADGLLITGNRTGDPPDPSDLAGAARAAGSSALVLAASGITAENVGLYSGRCSGFIVGTSLKSGGRTQAPMERERLRRLIQAIGEARSQRG